MTCFKTRGMMITLIRHGQHSRNVDMVVPGQKRHQGCGQDEKGRLQHEQVDTGREPPLRHNGEAG